MSERSIFLQALDIDDLTQRVAFLDSACAGDASLRQRVEALLQSHFGAGHFLDKLAPERLAEELAQEQTEHGSLRDSPESEKAQDELGFLTPTDKPGSLGRLGHFEILEVIGRGGMGIVLRALDAKLHRVVAVKVMAPELARTSPPRKRFLREARAAAAIRHEHVVAVRKEQMRRNPGFDGTIRHQIVDDAGTAIWIVTDKVTDIAPNRVWSALRVLDCGGTGTNAKSTEPLADLPLEGMNLAGLRHLTLGYTRGSDAGLAHFQVCKHLVAFTCTDPRWVLRGWTTSRTAGARRTSDCPGRG